MTKNFTDIKDSEVSLHILGEEYNLSAMALAGRTRALRAAIPNAPLPQRQEMLYRLRILYDEHADMKAAARYLESYYRERERWDA